MIAPCLATSAIVRAAASRVNISVADPAPMPENFVGVLTLRNMTSASAIDGATLVVKRDWLDAQGA